MKMILNKVLEILGVVCLLDNVTAKVASIFQNGFRKSKYGHGRACSIRSCLVYYVTIC